MEAYIPVSFTLDGTVSSETSSYPDWVSNDPYYKGDRVYNNGTNWELTWSFYQSTVAPYLTLGGVWIEVEQGTVEVSSYETTAEESLYSAWTSGAAVTEEAVYYDSVTQHDYAAATDISSGDNTIRPSTAVQSSNVDIAARWVDLGPANAFACLDDEISTRTVGTGEIEMTLKTSGQCNRIALFGLRNVTDISIDVDAAQLFIDPSFASAGLSNWFGSDATLSHLDPGMRITNTVTGTPGYGMIYMYGLVPGVSYTFSATISGVSGSGTWYVQQYNADLSSGSSSSTASGAATRSVTFTASTPWHRLTIALNASFAYVDVSAVSIKQASVSSDTLTADLEYGTTGRYARTCKLSHDLISGVEYVITLTGVAGSEIAVGLISAGKALTIGSTQTEVRAGGTQYHGIREDQYGNTRFVKRVRKRELSAVVWLDETQGDYVDNIMSTLEGRPVTWDFNQSTTSIERLIIHGWAEDWHTIVTGLSGNDYLSISPLKGLGE